MERKRGIHLYTSQGKNHPDQDVCGKKGNTFWVLDGATPLFPETYPQDLDTAGIMQMLNENLIQECNEERSPLENLKAACRKTEQMLSSLGSWDELPSYQKVSFAGAIACIRDHTLSCYVIGDCEVRLSDGTRIMDPGFDAPGRQNRNDERQILDQYHAHTWSDLNAEEYKEARKAFLLSCQKVRRKLNTPDGYWIGTMDGAGLDHGRSETLQIQQQDTVYVYCDGMAHLIDAYPDLLNAEDLASSIDQVRSFTDDDVTAGWCRV